MSFWPLSVERRSDLANGWETVLGKLDGGSLPCHDVAALINVNFRVKQSEMPRWREASGAGEGSKGELRADIKGAASTGRKRGLVGARLVDYDRGTCIDLVKDVGHFGDQADPVIDLI